MTEAADASWFPRGRPESDPAPALNADATQLFCLPHAGAGASTYREWPLLLAPDIDVIPVQLPGREGRHRERAPHTTADIVADLKGPIANRAGSNFALFGHSLGALLCYELAHELAELGQPPRHVFVSGLGAPVATPGPLLHQLSDPELLKAIDRLEGTSAEVLAQPELVQLLLPLFRADLEAWETYVPHRGALDVPITAIGGRSDPSVSAQMLCAWRDLTSAEFDYVLLDGGHFYHHSATNALMALLKARINGNPLTATGQAGARVRE